MTREKTILDIISKLWDELFYLNENYDVPLLPLNDLLHELSSRVSNKKLRSEDIICFEVSKALYKKQVDTGKYIKVAFITGDGKITFLARNEKVIDSPSYYDSLWYYLNEVGELRYSTFDMVNVNQIYVESSIEDDNYYVTGYIDDKGKAIYYDQYLNN